MAGHEEKSEQCATGGAVGTDLEPEIEYHTACKHGGSPQGGSGKYGGKQGHLHEVAAKKKHKYNACEVHEWALGRFIQVKGAHQPHEPGGRNQKHGKDQREHRGGEQQEPEVIFAG